MPQRWKDMVDAVKKNNLGKTNPRTHKPYTEADCYAIAMAQYKKKYGSTPTHQDFIDLIKEDKPDFFVLEYNVPIEITEAGKDFVIAGTAIDATVSRNNIRYLPEELNNSVESLKGVPILDSHKQDSVKNILGTVQDAFFDNSTNSIKFKGKIMDKEIQNMISDGRIRNVSIGAKVNDLPQDENSETVTAKGIEFLELSLVPIQGVKNATISQALYEKYEFVSNVEKTFNEIYGEIMTNEIKQEEVDALKKTVEDFKVLEATLNKENTELKTQLEGFKKTDERMTLIEKNLATLLEKVESFKKEEVKPVEAKVEEQVKAEPKTVVETIEKKKDDLVIERYRDGVSIWRMPSRI